MPRQGRTGAFPAGGVAVESRPRPTGKRSTQIAGPYDSESDDDPTLSGAADFGSLRLPLPEGGTLSSDPAASGGPMQAVHLSLPEGRLSVSALAAPKTDKLWPDLAKEIDASLRESGARVRSFTGEWGRELHATTGAATSLFLGADGPRWMVYGVATGPTSTAPALAEQLRRLLRGTVVVRGRAPYPVRTVLPLTVPDGMELDAGPAAAAKKPAGKPVKTRGADIAGAAAARPAPGAGATDVADVADVAEVDQPAAAEATGTTTTPAAEGTSAPAVASGRDDRASAPPVAAPDSTPPAPPTEAIPTGEPHREPLAARSGALPRRGEVPPAARSGAVPAVGATDRTPAVTPLDPPTERWRIPPIPAAAPGGAGTPPPAAASPSGAWPGAGAPRGPAGWGPPPAPGVPPGPDASGRFAPAGRPPAGPAPQAGPQSGGTGTRPPAPPRAGRPGQPHPGPWPAPGPAAGHPQATGAHPRAFPPPAAGPQATDAHRPATPAFPPPGGDPRATGARPPIAPGPPPPPSPRPGEGTGGWRPDADSGYFTPVTPPIAVPPAAGPPGGASGRFPVAGPASGQHPVEPPRRPGAPAPRGAERRPPGTAEPSPGGSTGSWFDEDPTAGLDASRSGSRSTGARPAAEARPAPEPGAARPTERLDLTSPTATRLAALAARRDRDGASAPAPDARPADRPSAPSATARPVAEASPLVGRTGAHPAARPATATGAHPAARPGVDSSTGSHPAAAARAGVAAARAAAQAQRTGRPAAPAPDGDLFDPAAPPPAARSWPWAESGEPVVPRGAETRPMPAATSKAATPDAGNADASRRSRHARPDDEAHPAPPAPAPGGDAPQRTGRHHRREAD